MVGKLLVSEFNYRSETSPSAGHSRNWLFNFEVTTKGNVTYIVSELRWGGSQSRNSANVRILGPGRNSVPSMEITACAVS